MVNISLKEGELDFEIYYKYTAIFDILHILQ